jgi:flagellin
MRINHNIAALNTHRQLNSASEAQGKSMEKLSSGLRINKAGDDAAGLAISEKMRGQIRGLDQASKNSQDAISMISTAEGALNETHDILQRMRELATQAANDTNTTTDRGEIQKEINSLTSEINRIGNTTEFNTQKLLNGSKDGAAKTAAVYKLASADIAFASTEKMTIGGIEYTATATDNAVAGLAKLVNADTNNKYTATANGDGTLTLTAKTAGTDTVAAGDFKKATTNVTQTTVTAGADGDSTKSLKFQIGANENQSLTLDISDMRSKALGLTTVGTDAKLGVTDGTSNTIQEQALDVSTHASAATAVTKIQTAIESVSAERSKLGANQNRLEHTINNLNTSSENLTAAESRIRDVDMAKEMMTQTKNSILSQAAQAMLAQSNQMPQGVLQLLR